MRFTLEFGRSDKRQQKETPAVSKTAETIPDNQAVVPKALTNSSWLARVFGDVDNSNDNSERSHQRNWALPWQIRTGAIYSLALLLIAGALYLLWTLFNQFADVTIPIAIALLFTAMLWPLVEWLERKGMWRSLAVVLSMLLFFGIITTLISLVGAQLSEQVPLLVTKAQQGLTEIPEWIHNLKLPGSEWINPQMIADKLKSMSGALISGTAHYATAFGMKISHFAAGLIMALFATFFFLYDGRRILRGCSTWLRPPVRHQLYVAGTYGWKSLVAYVRAIVIVAAVDGLFVGIGAAALGSGFYLSIGVLTFLMAFIPLLGAFLSGLVATVVVLVTLGFWKAVIMLIIYVAVNQLEGNVLHPFLLGKSVNLHPLLVLVGIAVGLTADGIVGALLVVPLLAFVWAFGKKLYHTDADGNLPADQDPDGRFTATAKLPTTEK